jgi:ferrous iron transport protein B
MIAAEQKLKRIALLGNPNAGKSSLFNALTGLNQKVGNFAGVTVDKKTGICRLSKDEKIEIIDLPGIYSLFAKSPDERVVLEVLLDENSNLRPDLILLILDAVNIERSLVLLTQAQELGIPVVAAINMLDVAEDQGLQFDLHNLQTALQVPILRINARKEDGIKELKALLRKQDLEQKLHSKTNFKEHLLLTQAPFLGFLEAEEKARLEAQLNQSEKDSTDIQLEDTFDRMNKIQLILEQVLRQEDKSTKTFSEKVDQIVTDPVWGYLIYGVVLLLIFQMIFVLADYPMTWIDEGFAALNGWLQSSLPESPLTSLLTDGVIAGIGGVVIFIPQIALLFGVIALLEESGYMSRVVFLMDRPMRLFGLSGKSVVPLISGAACAVPAIMAARSIGSWKERLVTVFVTPLISCAARLPVYVIIIALVIPDERFLGFNLQGLTLLGLYLIGILGALLTALVMRAFLKTKERSFFVMDLPSYKTPRWKAVLLTIYQKTRVFVLEAGKIILAISILLWGLASYGPPAAMQKAEEEAKVAFEKQDDQGQSYEDLLASKKLEASYIGHLGHFIEPAIRPLGYDWKIGIGLITSFAAREVFVGTLSTIYSVGDESEDKLIAKMNKATFRDSGKPVFTFATGISLLLFYAFAMQCMSTVAIVFRETAGWKWPIIQLIYMTGLAYILALIAYQILS